MLCKAMRPKQNVSKVPQIFRRVSVRGAVLVWRRCDTPYTSGFTDDVMFAHEAADKAVCLRTVSFFLLIFPRYKRFGLNFSFTPIVCLLTCLLIGHW